MFRKSTKYIEKIKKSHVFFYFSALQMQKVYYIVADLRFQAFL